MKLYHIDRMGAINEGHIINLNQNIYFENEFNNKILNLKINDYYKEGLSHHGINYFLYNPLSNNNSMSLSNVMDIIFEYERLLNYSDKLSRYQSFFAFDKDGVKQFIMNNNLCETFFKIYEVEAEYFEKYNMSIISGNNHYNIAAMAKCYWENNSDPYDRPILNEYLLKYPIKIIKEIRLSEIE